MDKNEPISFKVIVAGGRDFNDYNLMREKLDRLLSKRIETEKVIIVSGCAKGADSLGERYAEERNLHVIRKPANWDKFGKSAGYIRNAEMADISDGLIAFWNGNKEHSGTYHMVSLAKEHDLILRVIRY